ncbi:LOW QUALITY PROTEIN: hypothetical protein YC2023_032154 [Brassica napus]
MDSNINPLCVSYANGHGNRGTPIFQLFLFCFYKLTKGMLAEKYTMNWICITHLVQPKDMPDGPDHALFMLRTSLCDLERKE